MLNTATHEILHGEEDEVIDFAEFYGERQLRWYQNAAINELADSLEKGFMRILIIQPTGAGKTLTVAAAMSSSRIRRALKVFTDRPLRILFIALNHRLLTQAELTFVTDANVELITQSAFSEIPAEVIKAGWDVVIMDESHHESCSTIQYQLELLGNSPIIGLTATPDRPDGCLIKFEIFIQPISREQAVAEGYLAKTYLNTIVDAYSRDKVEITKLVIDEYHDQFGQTLMFFRTKKEAQQIADYLTARKLKAVAIINQTANELDRILNSFSDGEIQYIVNCNRLNEGIDVQHCSTVFLGRQYGSYPMINQVIGRAARPDSDCNVWELINPISKNNLDTTRVVGVPERHRLLSRRVKKWHEQEFDYVSNSSIWGSVI